MIKAIDGQYMQLGISSFAAAGSCTGEPLDSQGYQLLGLDLEHHRLVHCTWSVEPSVLIIVLFAFCNNDNKMK